MMDRIATMGMPQTASERGLPQRLFDGLRALLTARSTAAARKHLRVVETLAIGPKKQLLLVSCDGERFLVGTGPDSVHAIVRIRSEGVAAGEQRRCGV